MSESQIKQQEFGWAEHGATAAARTSPGEVRAAAAIVARRARAKVGEVELPPENELWNVQAAAKFLKRSVSWVYHRVEDGTLPVTRLAGWGVRFIPSELRAWVREAAVRGRPNTAKRAENARKP